MTERQRSQLLEVIVILNMLTLVVNAGRLVKQLRRH